MTRFLITLAATPLAFAAVARPAVPSDAEIRRILVERVDTFHQSVGIVVGVIDRTGRRVISYGSLDKGDTRPLGGDTVFEIGSITKVFTSLLLADMVQRGEVALNDPISKFLPAGTKVPMRNGRGITLVDLSTHTSGLPRLPSNFNPKDGSNPYADYSTTQLYAFLGSYAVPRDIGSQYEYSNLGVGLLGHVLTLRAGTDYATLVRARITDPLGMTDTGVTLSPAMASRLAVGHDRRLNRTASWQTGTLAGAYALRSTANDLLTFLAANLRYTETPLARAMAATTKAVRRPTATEGLEVGLAWQIRTEGGRIVWHNGETGGYRSFIGYDPKRRIGVVVLANADSAAGVDDIGGHVLDPTIDVLTAKNFPPRIHTQTAVDSRLFDGYVGRFQMAPNFILTISRDGDSLFAQATGQGRFPIFPEDDRDFFAKVADIQITFTTDSQGRATAIVVHQGGVDTSALRVP